MLTTFFVWLRMGFEHIADVQGYDHILFVISLIALYTFRDWKRILILLSAFTLGHTVTLALATLRIVQVDAALIEFLIPLTIFITGAMNVVMPEPRNTEILPPLRWKYTMAFTFGLIHGLGFSNFLRDLLGEEESILLPLFSFNVGLEVGQIVIVAIAMGLGYLVLTYTRLKIRQWSLVLSTAAMGLSAFLMLQRFEGLLRAFAALTV